MEIGTKLNLIRGQPKQEAGPIPKELAVPNQLLKLVVQGQEYSNENFLNQESL